MRNAEDILETNWEAFNFPAYYGENLDALNDCLNDLEWLNKPNYILIILNSKEFLAGETADIRDHILYFLERVAKEWANVPNYEGEELYRVKSELKIKMV